MPRWCSGKSQIAECGMANSECGLIVFCFQPSCKFSPPASLKTPRDHRYKATKKQRDKVAIRTQVLCLFGTLSLKLNLCVHGLSSEMHVSAVADDFTGTSSRLKIRLFKFRIRLSIFMLIINTIDNLPKFLYDLTHDYARS